MRCGDEFKIFTNIKGATADPKNFTEDNFITVKGEPSVLIPPNSFALASSLEYFKMPRNVTGLVTAKSSYARCGLGTSSNSTRSGLAWKFSFRIQTIHLIRYDFMLIVVRLKFYFFQGEQPEVSYAERTVKKVP